MIAGAFFVYAIYCGCGEKFNTKTPAVAQGYGGAGEGMKAKGQDRLLEGVSSD